MKIEQYPIDKYFESNEVKAVVFHVDLGTEKGTINHLSGTTSASYHFYIPRDKDRIIQFVQVEKGAWHSGRKHNPNTRAQKVFGSKSVNIQSVGICYEGLPLDKNGKKTSDYSKAVDGEIATEDQVKKAVWLIKALGYENLPMFSHKEITSYKPASVIDFTNRVIAGLNEEDEACSLAKFTQTELIAELIRRFRGK